MHKKIICFLICIAIICVCATASAAAPTVTLGSASVDAGDSVELLLSLSDCAGFSNMGLEVGYDSSVLTLTGALNCVPGTTYTPAKNYTVNPYNLGWNSTSNTIYNGTLAVLTFKVADDAQPGNYIVTLSYFRGRDKNFKDGYSVNYDTDWQPLSLTYVSGSITVGDLGELSEMTISDIECSASSTGFDITLPSQQQGGRIFAAICDSGGSVIEAKVYDTSDTLKVLFNHKGEYAKVLWWDFQFGLIPCAKEQIIKIQ